MIIIVDTAADVIANDGACSLREAITAANSNANYFGCIGSGGGYDLIEFSIGGGTPVINLATALPTITGPVEINGGLNRVELRGPGSGSGLVGLSLSGAGTAGSVIRNLVINGFTTGISLATTTNISIRGNRIGTNAAGTAAAANGQGVLLTSATGQIGGTSGVTPGGPCTGDCNLISGNTGPGVQLSTYSTAIVRGNFIGTNATGTSAIANNNGIRAWTSFVTIGGTTAAAGNLISGNAFGITINITMNPAGGGSVIQGNRIGSNAAGSAAVPNNLGISVDLGNHNYPLVIGGAAAGAGNLISGNTSWGVLLTDSDYVAIYGNLIGTRPDGITPLPNGGAGVELYSSQSNLIGGTAVPGQGNVIANGAVGVTNVFNSYYNQIRGNSIRANTGKGIALEDFASFAPLINGVSPVTGTACPGCIVDVYSDAADEGGTFHGTVAADGGGNWVFNGPVVGPYITATATTVEGAAGSTSEFSAPFAYAPMDSDGDGVPDFMDNCTLVANPTQCDSDGDGYGNHCDGDLNSNGFTNAQDTGLFRQQLGQPSVGPAYNTADLNCNGAVNAQDTALFRSLLGRPPGPSGLHP
ncbi:MAG: right-handed parallel beta-helix repeat-containing protein [Chromatiales bacterium]|nr:right-handed parallel beta-helix repeat-containing protein [Chromatiales bacterium]